MKNPKALFAVILMTAAEIIALPAAAATSEPLQAVFSSSGDRISIFTEFPIQDGAELLIANETIPADLVKDSVDIRTTILIDNSGSVPKNRRSEILDAIRSYVQAMPDNEQLRIAKFDTETSILSDTYSDDANYLDYQLEQITFTGQETYVYDALLAVTSSAELDEDVYSRTVLITDGIDTVGGTSFDLLRSEISEKGRYHIDVVQVSNNTQADVNLKGIGSLGSNTFQLFGENGSLIPLRPGPIYMLSAPLTNSVTTGEMKGITIRNGDKTISLGSFLIPQALLPEQETTLTSQETTTSTTAASTTAAVTEPAPEPSKGLPLYAVIGLSVLAAAGVFCGVFFGLFQKYCIIQVQISKDNQSDHAGTGRNEIRFPATKKGRFRVGRVEKPKDNQGRDLPENDLAICESASVSSIGRNAFELFVNGKDVCIRNNASSAVFCLEKPDSSAVELQPDRVHTLQNGDSILLGSYTTMKIESIQLKRARRRGKRGK